jgi:hypothetical protein
MSLQLSSGRLWLSQANVGMVVKIGMDGAHALRSYVILPAGVGDDIVRR